MLYYDMHLLPVLVELGCNTGLGRLMYAKALLAPLTKGGAILMVLLILCYRCDHELMEKYHGISWVSKDKDKDKDAFIGPKEFVSHMIDDTDKR